MGRGFTTQLHVSYCILTEGVTFLPSSFSFFLSVSPATNVFETLSFLLRFCFCCGLLSKVLCNLLRHFNCQSSILIIKFYLSEYLKVRSHDPEEAIRHDVIVSIVTAAKKDILLVNDHLLNFVRERTLDKRVSRNNN